jgi:hypothetical protein
VRIRAEPNGNRIQPYLEPASVPAKCEGRPNQQGRADSRAALSVWSSGPSSAGTPIQICPSAHPYFPSLAPLMSAYEHRSTAGPLAAVSSLVICDDWNGRSFRAVYISALAWSKSSTYSEIPGRSRSVEGQVSFR